jgi:hypothetical protein
MDIIHNFWRETANVLKKPIEKTGDMKYDIKMFLHDLEPFDLNIKKECTDYNSCKYIEKHVSLMQKEIRSHLILKYEENCDRTNIINSKICGLSHPNNLVFNKCTISLTTDKCDILKSRHHIFSAHF